MTYLKLVRKSAYLVNFLFKALFEHLICFVENHSLNMGEIEIAALNVIKHTAARAHEKVNSTTQFVSLVLDRHTAVDSQTFEFAGVVLQSGKFVLHLEGQFSGRAHKNGLDLTFSQHLVGTQVLRDGQAEGQGFPGTSQVARDDVFAVVNGVKRVLLHREQIDNASFDEFLGGFFGDFGVVFEFAVLDHVLFHIL